jgi:hypothetical protein
MDERMREAISFSAAEARGLVQVGALGFATHEAAVVGRLGLGVPILLAALAAAERRAEDAKLEAEARMNVNLERALTQPPNRADCWPDFVYAVRRRLGESGQPWVDMREYYQHSARLRTAAALPGEGER